MPENILCSPGGIPHPTAPSMSLLSVPPLGGKSFPVCRKRTKCLLQKTRTSNWFLSDFDEKFSGKQGTIMKCLGPGVVFAVFQGLVSSQALRNVSKNTHHGKSGTPQIRTIIATFSNVKLVYSYMK